MSWSGKGIESGISVAREVEKNSEGLLAEQSGEWWGKSGRATKDREVTE